MSNLLNFSGNTAQGVMPGVMSSSNKPKRVYKTKVQKQVELFSQMLNDPGYLMASDYEHFVSINYSDWLDLEGNES
ncbi:TPA: hypothetical protein DEP21_03025 [Patescibacteria group bacterium]|nr:hypothetical protein [Candidatus Gracilibacteria bacterium]